MYRSVENVTLDILSNRTSILEVQADYFDNFIQFCFSIPVLNASSQAFSLILNMRTELISVLMPFGDMSLTAGPLNWAQSTVNLTSSFTAGSPIQLDISPYDKYGNVIDPDYLIPCLGVEINCETDSSVTMIAPSVIGNSSNVNRPVIQLFMMITSSCNLTITLSHILYRDDSLSLNISISPAVFSPNFSALEQIESETITIMTDEFISDSERAQLQSKGIKVTTESMIYSSDTAVVSGHEVSVKMYLRDMYNNSLKDTTLLTAVITRENKQVYPDRLEIMPIKDNSFILFLLLLVPGSYKITILYNAQSFSSQLDLLILPSQQDAVLLYNEDGVCNLNLDAVIDDAEASILSSTPLLCGILGTRNLEATSFLVEVVLSFKHLLQGISVLTPITLSFQHTVTVYNLLKNRLIIDINSLFQPP